MDVVIHSTFEDAEASWREIEARGVGFVFQSFDWCATWFETIGRALRVEPVLVHVRDPGSGAEMFLPLGIRRQRFGVRVLGFLDGRLADHTAPILSGPTDIAFDESGTTSVLRRVGKAKKADVLDFRHLRARVDDVRNPLVGSRAQAATYGTHSLKLEGTWETFCAERLSKRHRARNRRRLRQLRESGTPLIVIAAALDQALAILDVALTQKARRYRDTGRTTILANDAYCEFYRRMTTRHHPSGLVHVAALILNEHVLATHWGCVYKKRFVYLLPSFDAGWSSASPGRLLLDHLIEWSFRSGLREFDFTIGDESYKLPYCDVSEELYRQIRPCSSIGWAYRVKAALDEPRARLASARPAAGGKSDTSSQPVGV